MQGIIKGGTFPPQADRYAVLFLFKRSIERVADKDHLPGEKRSSHISGFGKVIPF